MEYSVALPDISIPVNPVVLAVGSAVQGQSGPSPHVYAFTCPSSMWSWIGGLIRLQFNVVGDQPSDLGVYGADIPVISGKYGKLRCPPTGDAASYSGKICPGAGACWAVVRFSGAVPKYTIQITKV